MSDVLQVVQAGGDVGVWALVYLFHRFDIRLTVLESRE